MSIGLRADVKQSCLTAAENIQEYSMKGKTIGSISQINRILARHGSTSEPSKTVSMSEMDAEWEIIKAAKGNPSGFRPLYEKYYKPIFRFVMNRTQDEDLTADITSVVFMKAMKKLNGYEYRGVPFSAWLYRIASNEVTQHFRKLGKNRVVSIQDYHVSELLDQNYNEERYEDKKRMMVEMLQDLKEGDLQILELRFFEQKSFKKIAEILGITESNAKVKVYRIVERMKKKVKQSGKFQ